MPYWFLVITLFSIIFFCFSNRRICASEIFQTPAAENYITQTFTTENGLPQNSVISMVQTGDGFIWIATWGGLVRYDGVKFKIYTTGNTPELADNRISYLYEDRHGVLWIGSEGGILTNYKDGIFTLIKKTDSSLSDKIIFPIYLDKNDILWFKGSRHLNTYNIKTKEFSVIDNKLLSKSGLQMEDVIIKSFAEDSDNNLWLACDHGLIRFRNNKFTVFDKTDGLPDNFIYLAKENSNGNLLVVSGSKAGFFKDEKFVQLTEHPSNSFVFPAVNNIKNYIFYKLDQKLYCLAGDELSSFELPDANSVQSVLADNEGNVWIGKNLSLTQYKQRYVRIFLQNFEKDRFASVHAIVEDKDGSILVRSGHQILVWREGKFIPSIFSSGKNPEISQSYSSLDFMESVIARDKFGAVWIGKPDGLFKYENNSLTKLNTDNDAADKNFAHALLFSNIPGKIWSSSIGSGLQEYQDGKSRIYTTADGLIDNAVVCLMEDKNGALWIGTRSGISRFQNGVFTNYTTENGLTNNNVRDFYEDTDGTIWIGTYGGGILRYRDGTFASITNKNGLPEDIASRILIDDQDNFWILGNQGIYSVSRSLLNDFVDGKTKTVYCAVYGIKDGMKTSEGSGGEQNAGWKAHDGRLWFAMVEGGVIIDPPKKKSHIAPVYIEDVILGKKSFDPRKAVEINPAEKQLQINYTAVQFTQPEQIKFQYKLEGYDEDWQEAGTRRTAFYQFLPSGKYNFRVRAVTSDGVWSDNNTDLEINVRSGLILAENEDGTTSLLISFPFNQYWWLYSLMIVSLIIVTIVIIQKRLKKINRRHLEQQQFSRQLINAHESERYRIAAELHDSIGQSLALIKNMAIFGTKMAEDTNSVEQFENILNQSSETIDEIRDITYGLRPYLLDKLGLTEEIKTLLDKIAATNSIDIYPKIDDIDNLFSEEAEMNIYRIVQEILNNILKHSDASEAIVEIKKHQAIVSIKISDDGHGFEPDNLKNKNKRSGFGLQGLAERVQMIGGTYSIKSKISEGTTVLVDLKIFQNKKTN